MLRSTPILLCSLIWAISCFSGAQPDSAAKVIAIKQKETYYPHVTEIVDTFADKTEDEFLRIDLPCGEQFISDNSDLVTKTLTGSYRTYAFYVPSGIRHTKREFNLIAEIHEHPTPCEGATREDRK